MRKINVHVKQLENLRERGGSKAQQKGNFRQASPKEEDAQNARRERKRHERGNPKAPQKRRGRQPAATPDHPAPRNPFTYKQSIW